MAKTLTIPSLEWLEREKESLERLLRADCNWYKKGDLDQINKLIKEIKDVDMLREAVNEANKLIDILSGCHL